MIELRNTEKLMILTNIIYHSLLMMMMIMKMKMMMNSAAGRGPASARREPATESRTVRGERMSKTARFWMFRDTMIRRKVRQRY